MNNSAEVIDLQNPDQGWVKLNINLPVSGCDIGCLPISKTDVLIFGGWNKTAQKGAYVVTRGLYNHDVKQIGVMDQSDFFLVNGIGMATASPSQVRICGHTHVFTYNLESMRFEGSMTS